LASPHPSINRVKLIEWKSILFPSPRGLASKFFLLYYDAMSSSSSGRGKRERMETEGMVVELSPCGSLVGVTH